MSAPFTQRIDTIAKVAVAGQQGFFLPWGSYVRFADLLAVRVNGAAAAFASMARQSSSGGWPQPTTASVARGVWLAVPCAGGEVVEIDYRTRFLAMAPPEPAVIYAPGGLLPTGLVPTPGQQIRNSYQPSWPYPPDSILLPARAGLQVELWRRSRKLGRLRQALAVPGLYQVRQAKHYSPFWRSSLALADGQEIVDPFTTFFTGSQWRANYFKLCWYDPSSGARSVLSSRTLVAQRRDDRIPGGPPPTHPAGSLWIAGR